MPSTPTKTRRTNKGQTKYTDEVLRRLIAQCASRKEFEKRFGGAHSYVLKSKKLHLLNEKFGKPVRYTKEWVEDYFKKVPELTLNLLKTQERGVYNWCKRTKNTHLFDLVRGYSGNEASDVFLREVVSDPSFRMSPQGTFIRFQGKRTKPFLKKDKPIVRIYHEWGRSHFSLLRMMYMHFIGDIPPDYVVFVKDPNEPLSPHNLAAADRATACHAISPRTKQYKTNPEKAAEIRKLRKEGMKYKDLMEKFKLSKSTISYIVNNRVWKVKPAIAAPPPPPSPLPHE